LQEDPPKRPPTALAVAAALPGGDPLAAALAAGETPSPEVVANAGEVEGLRVPVAVACLAAIVISLVGLCFLRDRVDIVNQVPWKYPPEALAAKARELANSLGYVDWPVDAAFGWEYDEDYLAYARQQKDSPARWPLVRTNQPPAIRFWYRESPDYLVTQQIRGVTRTDPPPFDPGMVEVLLDTEGRLIGFDARPPSRSKVDGQAPTPDWSRLFALAGLDLTQFTPTQPTYTPPAFADAQMAWTGSYPRAAGDSLRLEAAACRGRLVSFRIIGPWTHPGPAPLVPYARSYVVFLVVLPIGGSLLAWRNARLGRGDRRGAFRLACFAFLCVLLFRLLVDNHVPSISEAAVLVFSLRDALLAAAIFWVLYMALEPQVRRRSPEMLISWSRLLAGKLRDPLVGAHLLVGGVVGVAASFFQALMTLALPFRDVLWIPQLATGAGDAWSLWALMLIFAVGVAMSYALLLNLLRFLVRRRWLAALLLVAVLALILQPAYVLAFPIVALFGVLAAGLGAYALARFGVVAAMATVFAHLVLRSFPLTTHLSAWYAKSALLAMLSVLALAIYAFHTTLAGRPLWRDELQEV